ncbi:MAG TPA: response regulator [Thermomicrobiales bacterium]|nr:response regulator [Thermomicrobiales bacterium]
MRPSTAGPADDADPSAPLREQMGRRHVLIINRDAALLDGARALLQDERYNVTTTSLVPRTPFMIAALAPDAIVVDLALDEPELWDFVDRLMMRPPLRHIPIIFTAADPALLERAQALPHFAGGQFAFLKPFRPADLVDCVHALVGPA